MDKKILNIALVAHDARKQELVKWCEFNAYTLKDHNLYATGTTAKLLSQIEFSETELNDLNEEYEETYKLSVQGLLSGPLGGDQQIGAMIAEGKIDILIFFCDNLITQGHHQDVGALTRLASLYNIGFATNRTTADMLLTSTLLTDPNYERIIPYTITNYANRKIK
jgi:methylglyoxal synthase